MSLSFRDWAHSFFAQFGLWNHSAEKDTTDATEIYIPQTAKAVAPPKPEVPPLSEEDFATARDQLFSELAIAASRIKKARNGEPFGQMIFEEDPKPDSKMNIAPADRTLIVTIGFPPDNSPKPNPIGFCKEWLYIDVLPPRDGSPRYSCKRWCIDNIFERHGNNLSLNALLDIIGNYGRHIQFTDCPKTLFQGSFGFTTPTAR